MSASQEAVKRLGDMQDASFSRMAAGGIEQKEQATPSSSSSQQQAAGASASAGSPLRQSQSAAESLADLHANMLRRDQSGPMQPRWSRQDSLLHLKGTSKRLVLGMVGLPARGKTYTARKLVRYLNWLGYKTKLFNVGEYRRKLIGAEQHSDFFDPTNEKAFSQREKMANLAMEDMFAFFKSGGQAAVFDGTNTTRSRRRKVLEYIVDNSGDLLVELMWIESICNDQSIVETNIRQTKLFSPDYVNMKAEDAIADFRARIAMYEKVYEPLHEDEGSWIKLIDVGRQVIVNRIQGYLPGRIVFFLMNLRINKEPLYISRHGESEFNKQARIGGDASLTEKGKEYAKALAQFIDKEPDVQNKLLSVWTSTLRRTSETVQFLKNKEDAVQWRALTEIQVGICDGLTYEEIEAKYPEEFKARHADKLHYRYPQGESYVDVISRLEPVIFELERIKGPVLVIGHRAVLRCLYAYFHDLPSDRIPYIDMPLHTVIKLVPKAYGCDEQRFPLAVSVGTPTLPPAVAEKSKDKDQLLT